MRFCVGIYRYRLIDEETGTELGPLVSQRPTFDAGETLDRKHGEALEVLEVVPAENEGFRAYLIVRRIKRTPR